MEIQPISNINSPNINVAGPNIIPTINPPVNKGVEVPVVRGMELPVILMPDTRIKYPTVNVPTQEEFDAAVKAEREKQTQEQQEKHRGLPDTKPVVPQVQIPVIDKQENKNIAEETNTPNTNLGVPVIEVPIVGEVPIPPKEQVILAGTTATASVAAALVGKSLVEWMVKKFKPVVERIFAQIKKALNRDVTDYELQLFFAYEHQKKVNKILKKEFKKQKLEQYRKAHNK
ncbi:MAG: hypothetical protein EBU90_13660 [Proteobacteria bacterium]|nr:hypothetical protein [Pseudomonadota bacterium]